MRKVRSGRGEELPQVVAESEAYDLCFAPSCLPGQDEDSPQEEDSAPSCLLLPMQAAAPVGTWGNKPLGAPGGKNTHK